MSVEDVKDCHVLGSYLLLRTCDFLFQEGVVVFADLFYLIPL